MSGFYLYLIKQMKFVGELVKRTKQALNIPQYLSNNLLFMLATLVKHESFFKAIKSVKVQTNILVIKNIFCQVIEVLSTLIF